MILFILYYIFIYFNISFYTTNNTNYPNYQPTHQKSFFRLIEIIFFQIPYLFRINFTPINTSDDKSFKTLIIFFSQFYPTISYLDTILIQQIKYKVQYKLVNKFDIKITSEIVLVEMKTQRFYHLDNISTNISIPKIRANTQYIAHDTILSHHNIDDIKFNQVFYRKSLIHHTYHTANIINQNMLHYIKKNSKKAQIEEQKRKVKQIFQKMDNKSKLIQIQHIYKLVKQLCKIYGYFIITQPMIRYNINQYIKLSIQIHPDLRSNKPLHPIKQQHVFISELICVQQLTGIIKSFFPNLFFGNAKTFTNVLAQIRTLKNLCQEDKQLCQLGIYNNKEHLEYFGKKKRYSHNSNKLIANFRAILSENRCKTQQDQSQCENNKKYFKHIQDHKKTTSTLLQSIRSVSTVKQNISIGLLNPIMAIQATKNIQKFKTNKQQNNSNSIPFQQKQPPPLSSRKQSSIKQNKPPQKPPHSNQPNEHSPKLPNNQNRISNHRLMSTSIQIQTEINKLFSSNDHIIQNNYYHSNKFTQNSMMLQIAQQFNELF